MANVTVGYDAGGSALTYTTLASAISGATAGDNLQVYYSDANKSPVWQEKMGDISSKPLSIEGMIPGKPIFACYIPPFIKTDGDLGGRTITIKNIHVIVYQDSDRNFYFLNANNASDAIVVEGCIVEGGLYGIIAYNIGAKVTVRNTVVIGTPSGASYGIGQETAGITIEFCTVLFCGRGVYLDGRTATVKNCLCAYNQYDFYGVNNATGSNNASSDGTAANGNWSSGSNNLSNQTRANFQFMRDNANGFYPHDFRVHTSSDMVGAGVAVSGITTDIDGQTRANPPTIGASEGISSFGTGGGGGGIAMAGMFG